MEDRRTLNEFCAKLERRYPIAWSIVAVVATVVRMLVRIYIPIVVCFAVMQQSIDDMIAEGGMNLPRMIPLLLAAVVLPFTVFGDRWLQYDTCRLRGGEKSPSLWHDLGVMLGSVSFWSAVVFCVLAILPQTPYLVEDFASLMPNDPPATRALYAAIVPSAGMIVYLSIVWWLSMRFTYRFSDPEEEAFKPQFPSVRRILLNGLGWVIGIILLIFVGRRVLPPVLYLIIYMVIKYWQPLVILVAIFAVASLLWKTLRVLRIRHACVKELRYELEQAGASYEFEKHPMLAAVLGGEPISLRIHFGEQTISVRMISAFNKKARLVVLPDGNVGFLKSISFGLPFRSTKRIRGLEGQLAEEESPALTQWLRKRETAFEDEMFPDAEKIYLIVPTPADWAMGELKKTVPINNGSVAYGYHMWTTTAFCRYIRQRAAAVRGEKLW
ncbi:MAG: hypothetical protein IJW97_04440 [Clostridia bacterium]|nr:hypothetical protein [Clostridia bacterium]